MIEWRILGGDDGRAYFSFLNKGKYEMFLKVDYD